MRLKTLLAVFSVIAMGDAVVALLVPGPFSNLIWPHRTGPEADLFVRGWGSCLMALGLIAWAAKSMDDSALRRRCVLGLFAYPFAASISWLVDGLSHGWTPLSAASFAGLVLFTLGFGYFRFADPEGATEQRLEHATNRG